MLSFIIEQFHHQFLQLRIIRLCPYLMSYVSINLEAELKIHQDPLLLSSYALKLSCYYDKLGKGAICEKSDACLPDAL